MEIGLDQQSAIDVVLSGIFFPSTALKLTDDYNCVDCVHLMLDKEDNVSS